jgi:hypothetical protein
MKLKGIEPELAESLIAEGYITEEDVVQAVSKNPPPKFMKAVEMMHLLLCHRDHDGGECEYYGEENLSSPWREKFHIVWIELVVGMTENYSVDEIIDSLFNVKHAMEALNDPLSIDLFNWAYTPKALSTTLLQGSPLSQEQEESASEESLEPEEQP